VIQSLLSITILLLFNPLTAGAADKRLIIHVDDYHTVEMGPFYTDQCNQNQAFDKHLISLSYSRHRDDVSSFQQRQREILIELIEKYDLDSLYQARLVVGDTKEFDKRVSIRKSIQQRLPEIESTSQTSAHGQLSVDLSIGNSGQFLVDQIIKQVHPFEDATLLAVANPMKSGQFRIDEQAYEARENFIIEQMLKSDDQVMILICGRGSDFSDNIPQGVELKRIEIPVKE
tara:strand:- start:312 stop:1001 length:690 start_codon:yes stop_codon:yes gene_type:complete